MAKVSVVFRIVVGILTLTGCGSLQQFDFSPTSIHPMPVKTALKDSAVMIAVPLQTEKKKTGGFRSIVDLQFDVRLTEPDGIEIPTVPNGLVVGIKKRW